MAGLCWMNNDGNKKIFQAHRTIFFPKLLKTNLLSETIVSQAQPTFICSNSALITAE